MLLWQQNYDNYSMDDLSYLICFTCIYSEKNCLNYWPGALVAWRLTAIAIVSSRIFVWGSGEDCVQR